MKPLAANHPLIPCGRILKATNAQIHYLLRDVLAVNYNSSAELQANLLVLFNLCKYMTADEFTYYLGLPENSYKSLHVQLNYLEKSGLIRKIKLTKKDGFARSYYYLSEHGYMAAASFFNEGVPAEFTRRGKEVSVLHDYSVGINALHLLLFKQPFTFIREFSLGSAPSGRDRVSSLRIDGICVFKNRPDRLFIEQDLGNEPNGVLIDKLVKYQLYGNMELPQTESIIFSFRKPYATCEPPVYAAYSPTFLNNLHTIMESKGYRSLKAFLQSPEGTCFASGECNKKIPAAINALIDTFQLKNPDETWRDDLSLSDIRTLASEIEELRCDYRVRDMNQQQYNFTVSKYYALAGILVTKYRRSNEQTTLFLSAMLRGFSVWAVPTNLLINYLPFICMNFSNMPQILENALKVLDPTIRYSNILLNSKLAKTGQASYQLSLRNVLLGANGKKYCIEYLSRDLGALMRAIRFREQYLSDRTGITLLCIVDSYKDALFFSDSDFLNCRGIESGIYFWLRDSLKSPSFFIIDADSKILPVSIK